MSAGITNGKLFCSQNDPNDVVILQDNFKGQKENTMNRSILLGLAMVASSVIGATAVNGLHAQSKAPGAYAALDLRAINSPDVFKTLPSKTGDFDGHTA